MNGHVLLVQSSLETFSPYVKKPPADKCSACYFDCKTNKHETIKTHEMMGGCNEVKQAVGENGFFREIRAKKKPNKNVS